MTAHAGTALHRRRAETIGRDLNRASEAIGWSIEQIRQLARGLTAKQMRPYEARLQRSKTLPKYDIVIKPIPGVSRVE